MLVVTLLGCGAAAPTATTTTLPPATTRTAPVDPCAEIAAPAVDLGLTCVAAGADAWVVEVEGLVESPGDDDGEVRTTGSYRLVYVRSDGTRARSEPRTFALGSVARFSLRALGTYDWDGDGAAELVIFAQRDEYDDGDATTDVWSAPRDGDRVVTLAAAADFAGSVDEVRDVDGDGRPDIVTMEPWRDGGWGYSESGGGWSGRPRTLRHARADGSFATGDDAGRAFWAAECGAVGVLVPRLGDPDDDETYERLGDALGNVTCAALTSASIDTVRARLEDEWSRGPCTLEPSECAALHDRLVERLREVEQARASSAAR